MGKKIVEITKKRWLSWYNKEIGNQYLVEDFSTDRYKVLNKGRFNDYYISKDCAKVITEGLTKDELKNELLDISKEVGGHIGDRIKEIEKRIL